MGGGIGPVEPDRVGEVYVIQQDKEGVLAQTAVDGGRAVEAFSVLNRHAKLSPNVDNRGPVHRLIELKSKAISIELQRTIIDLLKESGKGTESLLKNAVSVLSDLNNYQTDLGLDGEAVETALKLVVFFRQLIEKSTTTGLVELARSLKSLGHAYSANGRPEQARRALQHAVDLYRQLTENVSDKSSARLEAVLQGLDNWLSDLGRQEGTDRT